MSTYSGSLNPPLGQFPTGITNRRTVPRIIALPTKGLDPASWKQGSYTRPLHTVLHRDYVGWTWYGYLHDYYNRVWLIPTTVDFGPLTTLTEKRIFLWNAHLSGVTLSAVTPPDLDDSLYISGLTLPLAINALGGEYFSLWAKAAGEPTINATFTFEFTPGEVITLPVAGIRARLWPFPMNWGDGYNVALEYRTEIITSESGKEQRLAVRQTPRKTVDFHSIVNEGAFRTFVRQMANWQGRTTVIPDFSRFGKTKFDVSSGDSMTVEEVMPWMTAGVLVVCQFGGETMIRTIDSITGDVVTFTSAIAGSWMAGSKLFKGLSGHLANAVTTEQHTNRTATVAVSFSVDPGTEFFAVPPSADTTWRGREVFLKRPNWAEAMSPSYQTQLQTLDYGKGRLDFFLPVLFNDRYHTATYLARDIHEGQDIEDLYLRLMGQQTEFYMPTYTDDIELGYDLIATTAVMRILGPEFAGDYKDDIVYKDLIIFLEGGSYLIKTVQQIYAVDDPTGNDSIIQTTTPFSADISLDSIRQICWMPQWRMGSDTLSLSYVTDEVCQFQITMKTVPYEETE